MNQKFKYPITTFTDLLGKFKLYDLIGKLTAGRRGKEFLTRIINLAELNGDEKILDVGCGTGTLACEITRKYNGVLISGIDISEYLIKVARRKTKRYCYNVDYRIGSALELPYEENTFNVVFTTIMFHQLDVNEKWRAVQEIYRILKSKGRYVSAEFGPKAETKLRRMLAKGEWSLYPSHLHEAGFEITFEELAKAMRGKKVFYRVAKK
jgi:ubiquinone/menaquinone biosynthesis C-methylase UbiE